MYTRRLRQTIGALTVTLGGVDALVFTAGCWRTHGGSAARDFRGLECPSELNDAANSVCKPDADIATPKSRPHSGDRNARDVSIVREVVRVLRMASDE